jgi:hypothetical protein
MQRKRAVLWAMTPYSPVYMCQRFGGTCFVYPLTCGWWQRISSKHRSTSTRIHDAIAQELSSFQLFLCTRPSLNVAELKKKRSKFFQEVTHVASTWRLKLMKSCRTASGVTTSIPISRLTQSRNHWVQGFFSSSVMQPERYAKYSSISRSKAKNAWSYNSTLYVFMTWQSSDSKCLSNADQNGVTAGW